MTIIGALLQKLISRSTWKTVEWIFYIFFPTYCLSAVLQNICDNHNKHNSCTQMAPGVTLAELCLSKKRLGQSSPCCLGKRCFYVIFKFINLACIRYAHGVYIDVTRRGYMLGFTLNFVSDCYILLSYVSNYKCISWGFE